MWPRLFTVTCVMPQTPARRTKGKINRKRRRRRRRERLSVKFAINCASQLSCEVSQAYKREYSKYAITSSASSNIFLIIHIYHSIFVYLICILICCSFSFEKYSKIYSKCLTWKIIQMSYNYMFKLSYLFLINIKIYLLKVTVH